MKTVQIVGHSFDCLPGHVQISTRGSGSTVRVAMHRAIDNLFGDRRLYRKQVGDFKISAVVVVELKPPFVPYDRTIAKDGVA